MNSHLTMDGIVEEVDAASGHLGVVVHGVAKRFAVSPRCSIDRAGTRLDLSQIKVRDRVRIWCHPERDGLRAHIVNVYHQPWLRRA
jgi:hypothetical protein